MQHGLKLFEHQVDELKYVNNSFECNKQKLLLLLWMCEISVCA